MCDILLRPDLLIDREHRQKFKNCSEKENPNKYKICKMNASHKINKKNSTDEQTEIQYIKQKIYDI